MPPEPERARSLIEHPGRLAAIGVAAVVCLLSVSGALGFSLTSTHHSAAQHEAALLTTEGTSDGGQAGGGVKPGGGITSPGEQAGTNGGGDSGTSGSAQSAALPKNSGEGKRIVFGITAQRVWLVGSDGTVVRTYLVSGSKYHNLSVGTYHVSSRSRYATAYNSAETMNYMVRFTTGRTGAPIGFHSVPAYPDGKLVEPRADLGAPASDGCIRQWINDARVLWNFAPDGTTVVVLA